MIACLSPNGSTHFAGAEVDRLLIGTIDGVVVAVDEGESWHKTTVGLKGRHISSIAWDPVVQSVFVGTYDGGLFLSKDLGDSWQELGNGTFRGLKVYSIATRSTTSGTRLYVGTEPVHLFFSVDEGSSFEELVTLRDVPNSHQWWFPAPPHEGHVKNVAFHPSETDTLFVCVEQGGLYKSLDNGQTWEELDSIAELDNNLGKDAHRLVVNASDPMVLHLTGGDGSSSSDNGGLSWRRQTDRSFPIGYPDGLVTSNSNQELLFMSGASSAPGTWDDPNSANAHVARSRDGGKNWELVDGDLPVPMHGNIEAMSIASSSNGMTLIIGTTDGDVFLSDDEGEHWHRALTGVGAVSKGGHYRHLH